jgi:uncharacterized protein
VTRLLFWIAIAILVVMAVRSKLRAAFGPQGDTPGAPVPNAGPAPGAARAPAQVVDASERMACCAGCGMHFPSSEAVAVAGREYCCAAHAPRA